MPHNFSTYIAQCYDYAFFKGKEGVIAEMDDYVWLRTRLYMFSTASLVAVWGIFDVLIDLENLWFFLLLRAIYTPITFLWAYCFHWSIFRHHHYQWASVHFLLLIVDIGIMVLYTDEFIKYLIGFSTIFWGASVIMLWRFWNTLIPGIVVMGIAWIRFTFFPHNIPSEELITGLMYFVTCMIFVSLIGAVSYRSAYQQTESAIQLKRFQDKLIESKKQSSLNMVVSGVAHEMRTPIGSSITAVSHAELQIDHILLAIKKDEISLDDIKIPALSVQRCLKTTEQQLQRTAHLVDKFSRTSVDVSKQQRRTFDVLHYIHEYIIHNTLSARLSAGNVSFDLLSESDTLTLYTDPGLIADILVNLGINSMTHGFDALNDGRDKHIQLEVNTIESNVVMTYKDNGRGMTDHTKEHLYEHFFSTKGTDESSIKRGQEGSGLGMSVVYKTVTSDLQGDIEVKSTLNMGTSFTITFPIPPAPTSNKR